MGRIRRLGAFFVAAALAASWVVALPAPAAAAVPVGPWSSLNPGTSEGLISISCPGPGTCYAVGGNGTIIVTRDGGASWSSLASGTSNRLDSISCPTVLTCFVAGPFPPTLLVTTDGGATWLDKSSFAPQPLAAISCADVTTCVAVGLVGTAVRTSDGGATWSTSNAPTGSFLLGVSCPTTTTCYADGAATSAIVKTNDGGATWSDVTPGSAAFLDIFCSSALACIAVGSPGLGDAPIMTTGDGGATWTNRASNTTNDLASVTCFGVGHCFAVGRSGAILASDNAGATWSAQQNTSNYLNTVSCLSESVCFAVGQFGTVMASPAGPRTVTNANDAGPGSLRAAIDYANGHQGPDTITFGIGTGPHSIALQSGLPAITDRTVIDASTQPGYAGAPIIELNGISAGVATGLFVSAGSSTLRGFVINRFHGNGMFLGFGGGNVVQGNYVGVDMSGTSASPNDGNGVVVLGPSTNNLIGGPGPADRNVISANGDKGVVIAQGGSATVQGNYLGTDVTGNVALPNRYFGVAMEPGYNSRVTGNLVSGNGVAGVVIGGGSSNNVVDGNLVGTNAAGTGALGNGEWGVVFNNGPNNTVGPGNVISGNVRSGVALFQSTGVRVIGNLIGTDITGTHPLANREVGVSLDQSDHNTVGGANPADRNVISGNGSNGVSIGGSSNVVAGNFVGLDRSGSHGLANGTDGVFVYAGSSNVIADRNVISGNALNGVNLGGPNTTGTVVAGNYIGTDATGQSPVGNLLNGIVISASPGNIVGPGNVLSGNLGSGLLIYGTTGTGNLVQGNLIGTDVTGAAPLPNQSWGIALDGAPGNTIGGTSPGDRNVVSGNALDGILLAGPGSSSNQVQGNLVGTDASGAQPIPNSRNGVVMDRAGHNAIGGSSAGAGNVISSNPGFGVAIFGGEGSNSVQGNLLGTDASGSAALGNGFGVFVINSPDNVIGGTTAGAGNVMSGNTANGINILGAETSHTIVEGNLIGTDRSGQHALGNSGHGVVVGDSSDNMIGGTSAASRNVISGNGAGGVTIVDATSTRNVVEGNYIGTDITGVDALGNGLGIVIGDAPGNVVGGIDPGSGNVVSGNHGHGVLIYGSHGTHNLVQGNLVGTDRSGKVALGNDTWGVVLDGAPGNIVGGTSPAARNFMSGNGFDGMLITGTGATGNSVQGNFIGTDISGNDPIPNRFNGIAIEGGNQNSIGGAGAGEGNLIAFNGAIGVVVRSGTGDTIRGNNIFANGGLGIDLGDDGVTPNDRGDGDSGPNNLLNYPVITIAVGAPPQLVIVGSIDTPNPSTVVVDIYANGVADPSGHGEGQMLIGTVTPHSDGRFTITLAPQPKGTVISATATDARGNTSEFSLDVAVGP